MKSRRMRWEGLVVGMGESGGACWVLVSKPEGRRLLGTSGHRREDIKIDYKE
jgi:hypothetical protein